MNAESGGVVSINMNALPFYLSERMKRTERGNAQANRRYMPKVEGRIAIIPLIDVMSRSGRSGTSTAAFVRAVEKARDERDVGGIVLDVDSPGGTVNGTPETATAVREANTEKPVVGYTPGMAASAALWVITAARSVVGAPSSEVGSVGAYQLHFEVSKLLEEIGIKTEFIRAPEGKADFNFLEPLTDAARADAQASVNEAREEFEQTVAMQRKVSVTHVRDHFGKGRMLSADRALKAKLIDRTATMSEVLSEMTKGVGKGDKDKAQESEDRITAAWLGVSDEEYAEQKKLQRDRYRHS